MIKDFELGESETTGITDTVISLRLRDHSIDHCQAGYRHVPGSSQQEDDRESRLRFDANDHDSCTYPSAAKTR
jgi:hypothetical protein